jgi:hypothetical protein
VSTRHVCHSYSAFTSRTVLPRHTDLAVESSAASTMHLGLIRSRMHLFVSWSDSSPFVAASCSLFHVGSGTHAQKLPHSCDTVTLLGTPLNFQKSRHLMQRSFKPHRSLCASGMTSAEGCRIQRSAHSQVDSDRSVLATNFNQSNPLESIMTGSPVTRALTTTHLCNAISRSSYCRSCSPTLFLKK